MKKIKKGDIVARKSYGKDIIFYVKRIIRTINGDIAILCGLVKRIEADSRVEDLEMWLKLLQKYRIYLINKPVAYYRLHQHNSSIINRLNNLKDELYIIGSQKNFAVHNNCQIEFYNKIATLIAFINKIDPDYAKYSMKLYKLEVIQTSAYSFNYKIIE